MKKNLYYEIKDVVTEERNDGIHTYKQKIRTKVYGLNSTKSVRKELIDLLVERVEHHKDKFISPIIYNELLGMEIKRSGKIEHSSNTHDDQIFSLLMALHVWYNGTNLAERYGIRKTSIRTDEDGLEEVDYFNPETTEIVGSFNTPTELEDELNKFIEPMMNDKTTDIQSFINETHLKELEQYKSLLNTPMGERAFRQLYHIPDDQPISKYMNTETNVIPDSVLLNFYNDNINGMIDVPFAPSVVPAGAEQYLEDGEYKYSNMFNW